MDIRDSEIIRMLCVVNRKTFYLPTFQKSYTNPYVKELFNDIFIRFPMVLYSTENEIEKIHEKIKNTTIDSSIKYSFFSYWASQALSYHQFYQYSVLSGITKMMINEY
jgi:hypothetical protein